MDLSLPSKLLGCTLAFGAMVAWMVPPMTPRAPEAGSWRDRLAYRFDGSGVAASAAASYPVVPPAVAPRAEPAPAQVAAPAEEIEGPAPVMHAAVAEAVPPAPAPRPQDEPDPGRARFDQGYRWAGQRDVRDERECYGEPGDPFEDGCMRYLRDAYYRSAARWRDDYGAPPYAYRDEGW